jgi:hypothetical protein
MTIADWIARFIPVAKVAAGGEIIVWQHGALPKAVLERRCGIVDGIDADPAKIGERLNGALCPKRLHPTCSSIFPRIRNSLSSTPLGFPTHCAVHLRSSGRSVPCTAESFQRRLYAQPQENIKPDERQGFIAQTFQATLDPDFASRVPVRLPDQLSAPCPSDFPVAELLNSAELQLGKFPIAQDSVPPPVSFVQNLMGTESDFDVPDTFHARLLDRLN